MPVPTRLSNGDASSRPNAAAYREATTQEVCPAICRQGELESSGTNRQPLNARLPPMKYIEPERAEGLAKRRHPQSDDNTEHASQLRLRHPRWYRPIRPNSVHWHRSSGPESGTVGQRDCGITRKPSSSAHHRPERDKTKV